MASVVYTDGNLLRRPMRIAAGGMLSLAALFSAFVALGFLVGGPFAVELGGMLDGGAGAFSRGVAGAFESLGGADVLGRVLLASAIVVFAGAVSVFSSLYPRVIYLACATAILSALVGIRATAFGLPYAVGIVAGGLGFISGLRIQLGMAEVAAGRAARPLPRGLGDWLAVGAIVGGLCVVSAASFLAFGRA